MTQLWSQNHIGKIVNRTKEECECEEVWLRIGLPLVAIATMSKTNMYFFLHYKFKNCLAFIPFQMERLLEIEVKCYHFHTFPTEGQ